MKRLAVLLGIIVVMLFAWTLVSGDDQGLQLLFHLLGGWIGYLRSTLPHVRINWTTLISTLVCLIIFTAGAHWFARWLVRECNRFSDGPRPIWRIRWTAAAVAVIVVMFAAGTGAVGVAHQVVFLATSPKPMFHVNPRQSLMFCKMNMREIGKSLERYAAERGGHYPQSLSDLLGAKLIDRDTLLCPADETKLTGATTEPSPHSSYVYLGVGLLQTVDSDRILLYETGDHHDGVVNVVRSGGEVATVSHEELPELLEKEKQATTTPR